MFHYTQTQEGNLKSFVAGGRSATLRLYVYDRRTDEVAVLTGNSVPNEPFSTLLADNNYVVSNVT